MRRKIRIAGFALVWTGILTLGVVAYQLFVTDALNDRAQIQARSELAADLVERRSDLATPVTITVPETTPDGGVTPQPTPDPIRFHPEEPVGEGEPFGLIRIPEIELERVLFAGVTPPTLMDGPGHMPWTSLPGQPGNAVISGHRTTYGAPFFDLDLLQPGDTVEVETAIGLHRYTVRDLILVGPSDTWVTDPRPGAWLTLTTCNPKYSAAERLIVQAELTEGPNYDYARTLYEDEFSDVS